MQIYRSKVPFYVNISNPDRVQRFWPGSTVQFTAFFIFWWKKKEQEKLDFQSIIRGYLRSCKMKWWIPHPISPGPFIGPVEIRGGGNKKIYISLSLLSTDGGLNLAPKGWIWHRLGYQHIHIPETIEGDIRSLWNQSQTKEDEISVRVLSWNIW